MSEIFFAPTALLFNYPPPKSSNGTNPTPLLLLFFFPCCVCIHSVNCRGDVFVHYSDIQGEGFRMLVEGQTVEFDVGEQDDGRSRAIDVTGPDGEKIIATPRSETGNGEYDGW